MTDRQFTLGALAAALGASLDGDPAHVVTGVAPLDIAGPDDVSFLTDSRYRDAARASRAGALLTSRETESLGPAMLRVDQPQQVLVRLLTLFHPRPPVTAGIHATAVVAKEARVDATAAIGPLAVVGAGARIGARVRIHPLACVAPDVEVGEDSEIHSGVVLAERVRLGRRVIVHAGAVIGSDGFGYLFDGGAHQKIPQVGTVVIEDDVEIGANVAIDRATLGVTVVRRGTKIDNLVQVGHNVDIGEHSILVAQVGISGSSRLGRGVVLGGQVGVADHVRVGDGAMVGAQSGLHRDVEAGAKLLGSPAHPIVHAKRIYLTQAQLPDLARKVRELERRIARLEGAAKATDG